MDAWLQHHCTPTQPPPHTELMVSGADDDNIFPVRHLQEKKKNHIMAVTSALPLFNVSLILG